MYNLSLSLKKNDPFVYHHRFIPLYPFSKKTMLVHDLMNKRKKRFCTFPQLIN